MEQMVMNISETNELSPSLKDIVTMFDENSKRSPDMFSFAQSSAEPDYEASGNNDLECDQHDASGAWDFVADPKNGQPYEFPDDKEEEPFMPNYHEENDEYVSHDPDVYGRFVRVDDFMFLKLGLTAKQNAWAGPDHWKYQKAKVHQAGEGCCSPR